MPKFSKNDATVAVGVPPNQYEVEILEAEKRQGTAAASGKEFKVLDLNAKVVEGDYTGEYVRGSIFLSFEDSSDVQIKKTNRTIAGFMNSIGCFNDVDADDEIDFPIKSEIVGSTALVETIIDADGYSKIKRWLPAEEVETEKPAPKAKAKAKPKAKPVKSQKADDDAETTDDDTETDEDWDDF